MPKRTPVPTLKAQMSRTSGSATEWRLRLEDRDSGVQLLEVALDDTAFADLLSTKQANARVINMASPKAYGHIGWTSTTRSVEVPPEVYEGTGYGSPAREQAAAVWAARTAENNGEELTDVRIRQGGKVEALFTLYTSRKG